MNEPRKLSAYVEPRLGDARLDAQWSRIAERLPAPAPRSKLRFGLAPALALVAGLTIFWLSGDATRESGWEGSVVSSDDSPVEMTLAEGSLVELSPRSEVQLLHSSARALQLKLSHGSARFAVSKRPARSFSVRSGPIEVLVAGSEFRLSRAPAKGGEHVRVDVDDGAVEVRRNDTDESSVKLVQGEHWSTFVAYEKTAAAPAELVHVTPVSQPDGDAARADDGLETEGESRQTRRARRSQASDSVQAAPATELFDRANIARRAGQLRDAAALYAEVVQRFPRDRSAALSAFELGRIRMDGLADPRGAVQAFERALALDGRRAFAEDALARLALAHDALGDATSCRREKERYLQRYPDGVHANILSKRCP